MNYVLYVIRAEKLWQLEQWVPLSSTGEAENRWRYSSVVGYSPDSNTMSTEAEESPLLRAVIKQRPVKALQAGEYLAWSDLWTVEISDNAVIACCS
jgi:hypothetical protein